MHSSRKKNYLTIHCVSVFEGNILSENRIFRIHTVCQGKYVFTVLKKHKLKHQKFLHKRNFKNGLMFVAGLTEEKISDIQRMNNTRIYVHCQKYLSFLTRITLVPEIFYCDF